MAKYDERFKLEVGQQYLSGTDGTKRVAARYGLSAGELRRWVAAYQHQGVAA